MFAKNSESSGKSGGLFGGKFDAARDKGKFDAARDKGKFDAERDRYEGRFVAAEQTNLPLGDLMTRMLAEELPILDSHSRGEVYRLLREYEGPLIETQEQLPAEIRAILDI